MLEELSDYDWEEVFKYADNPDWVTLPGYLMEAFEVKPVPSSMPIKRDDVVEIYAMSNGVNDEAEWIIFGRTTDGRHFFLAAGCDYTGWGCQEYGRSYAAYEKAIIEQFAITIEERVRLGLC
jgi:hypothetical protein